MEVPIRAFRKRLGGEFEAFEIGEDFRITESEIEKMLESDFVHVQIVREGIAVLNYIALTDPIRGRLILGCADESDTEKIIAQYRKKWEAPVLSANDLYNMASAMDEPSCHRFSFYRIHEWIGDRLPGLDSFSLPTDAIEEAERLEVRSIVHMPIDSDESWDLATLWFDGSPFAVAQSWNEDDRECYVTDSKVLAQLVEWLRSMLPAEKRDLDPAVPNYRLTEFGRHVLADFLKP